MKKAPVLPELWTVWQVGTDEGLARVPETLPDKLPEIEPESPLTPPGPARDWTAEATAYLIKLGRPWTPAAKFTAPTWRYLNGPLVVGSSAWGENLPRWLRDAVKVARLGLILAGETELASEEEAVAYLLAASLAAPLARDWAELYFWLCARVLPRWGQVQEADFWAMLGETHPHSLTHIQEANLRRLLGDIRRSVAKHAAKT